MGRLGKWRRFLWLILPLTFLSGWWWYRKVQGKEKRPYIQVAKVRRTTVTLTISASGTIQPYKVVDVKSKAAGKVIEMAVEVGDRVKRGDLICRIDPTDVQTAVKQAQADLEAALARVQQAIVNWRMQRQITPAQLEEARQAVITAKARLKQSEQALHAQRRQVEAQIRQAEEAVKAAKARYEQAKRRAEAQRSLTKASLEQAEAAYQSALENLRQLKEAIIPQQRAQAKAAYEQAKAEAENAQKELQRQWELFQKGFIAKSQLDAAQARYKAAKAQFEAASEKLRTLGQELKAMQKTAEARVREAKAQLESARERVRTLEAELEARRREAEARLAQAKAQREIAKAEAIQVDLLRREVEAALAALRQAEAQWEAAKAGRALIAQREAEVEAARAALRQAEAAYQKALANAQQVKLREADIKTAKAQVERALAQLKNARIQLADTVIVAPRDGVILEKLVEEGTVISSGMSIFSQGTTIVRLADMSRVFIDAEVAEADIGSVWVGQKVLVSVDAFPEKVFQGKVIRIDPKTTEEQNVIYVHVWVELFDPDDRLKPGMSATCDFIVAERHNVIAVPNEALKEAGKGRYYVQVAKRLNPHPQLERRFVRVGLQGTELTEIRGGLRVGERVVTAFFVPREVEPPPFARRREGTTRRMMRGMRFLRRR